MPGHVIIDGNNLLHAMHAHAPVPAVGRETLVKVIDRWADRFDENVTLVFDGPIPREGLARQMTSTRITVRFSAPLTADDVIVAMIQEVKDPGMVRVVTSDTAIRREASYKRCRCTDVVGFVAELFPAEDETPPTSRPSQEKPDRVSPEEAQKWLDLFSRGDNSPPDATSQTDDDPCTRPK